MDHQKVVSTDPEALLLVQVLKYPAGSPDVILPEDIAKLITLAKLHGVLPQLYNYLKQHNKQSPFFNTLHSTYREITKANLLLTAHLLLLTRSLEKNKFHYLAIKGPALSQLLHGNISSRQYSDIDLFVEETDIYTMSQHIISLGYIPVLPLSLLNNQTFLALDNDFSFRHQKTNALLELHWKLFPVRHHMPLDFQTLYKNREQFLLQDQEVSTLSKEDNLLYLALHGAKHIFERYEWVYDLHLLLSQNDIQIDRVYQKAKKSQIEVPFLLGIFLTQTLFGTEIPEHFTAYRTAHIQTLIDKTLNYYGQGFVYWDESDKKRARFLFLSALSQHRESQVLWLFKSLFQTTPVDVITFNLPDRLSFLYPLLRPFRLLYKHIFTKKPQYASIES